MTVKYHVSPAGPRRCRASIRACRYTEAGEPHFGSQEAAQRYWEKKVVDQFGEFAVASRSAAEKLRQAAYHAHDVILKKMRKRRTRSLKAKQQVLNNTRARENRPHQVGGGVTDAPRMTARMRILGALKSASGVKNLLPSIRKRRLGGKAHSVMDEDYKERVSIMNRARGAGRSGHERVMRQVDKAMDRIAPALTKAERKVLETAVPAAKKAAAKAYNAPIRIRYLRPSEVRIGDNVRLYGRVSAIKDLGGGDRAVTFRYRGKDGSICSHTFKFKHDHTMVLPGRSARQHVRSFRRSPFGRKAIRTARTVAAIIMTTASIHENKPVRATTSSSRAASVHDLNPKRRNLVKSEDMAKAA